MAYYERRAFRSANHIVTERSERARYDAHRAAVARVRARIDTGPPRAYAHLQRNAKKEQMMEERYTQIEHDNLLLLNRMHTILHAEPAWIADTAAHASAPKSLNIRARRTELMRIMEDNHAILHRIQTVEPIMDADRLREEGELQELRLRMVSTFASGRRGDRSRPFVPIHGDVYYPPRSASRASRPVSASVARTHSPTAYSRPEHAFEVHADPSVSAALGDPDLTRATLQDNKDVHRGFYFPAPPSPRTRPASAGPRMRTVSRPASGMRHRQAVAEARAAGVPGPLSQGADAAPGSRAPLALHASSPASSPPHARMMALPPSGAGTLPHGAQSSHAVAVASTAMDTVEHPRPASSQISSRSTSRPQSRGGSRPQSAAGRGQVHSVVVGGVRMSAPATGGSTSLLRRPPSAGRISASAAGGPLKPGELSSRASLSSVPEGDLTDGAQLGKSTTVRMSPYAVPLAFPSVKPSTPKSMLTGGRAGQSRPASASSAVASTDNLPNVNTDTDVGNAQQLANKLSTPRRGSKPQVRPLSPPIAQGGYTAGLNNSGNTSPVALKDSRSSPRGANTGAVLVPVFSASTDAFAVYGASARPAAQRRSGSANTKSREDLGVSSRPQSGAQTRLTPQLVPAQAIEGPRATAVPLTQDDEDEALGIQHVEEGEGSIGEEAAVATLAPVPSEEVRPGPRCAASQRSTSHPTSDSASTAPGAAEFSGPASRRSSFDHRAATDSSPVPGAADVDLLRLVQDDNPSTAGIPLDELEEHHLQALPRPWSAHNSARANSIGSGAASASTQPTSVAPQPPTQPTTSTTLTGAAVTQPGGGSGGTRPTSARLRPESARRTRRPESANAAGRPAPAASIPSVGSSSSMTQPAAATALTPTIEVASELESVAPGPPGSALSPTDTDGGRRSASALIAPSASGPALLSADAPTMLLDMAGLDTPVHQQGTELTPVMEGQSMFTAAASDVLLATPHTETPNNGSIHIEQEPSVAHEAVDAGRGEREPTKEAHDADETDSLLIADDGDDDDDVEEALRRVTSRNDASPTAGGASKSLLDAAARPPARLGDMHPTSTDDAEEEYPDDTEAVVETSTRSPPSSLPTPAQRTADDSIATSQAPDVGARAAVSEEDRGADDDDAAALEDIADEYDGDLDF